MSRRKKSLAEELAELSSPAPAKELDPEADIFDSGPILEESDEELAKYTKSKGKEKPRLRGDIALNGIEYSGKKSSRKDIFEEDEIVDEDDASVSDGNDDDSSQESDEEDSTSDSDQLEQQEEEDRVDEFGVLNNNYSDKHDDNDDDEETATLDEEYRAMQRAEADAMRHLQERAAKERRKAIAVRSQRSIWNSGLEIRILLQKALQSANKLPQPKSHPAIAAVDEELANGLKNVVNDASHVVEDLIALLKGMGDNNPAMKDEMSAVLLAGSNGTAATSDDDDGDETDLSKGKNKKKRRSSDALWKQLDASYQCFVPYRDASIDRWHRKTMLTTGDAVRSGLKVLNQSISSQVELLMKDSEKLVERSRLPKRQRTVLCQIADDDEGESRDDDQGDMIVGVHEDRDPETYDDAEFYQALLKEFLESKNDNGTMNQYTGPKQRKLVDRRASKGRKLRYHIHEKLVNFMMPVELKAPQYATNVFNNLFGGGVQKS